MSATENGNKLNRKMYDLLIDFELKIAELNRTAKQRKRAKKSAESTDEIKRLKLHRKLLKNNLKWLKSASKKQKLAYQSETLDTFEKAKKAFLKSKESTN